MVFRGLPCQWLVTVLFTVASSQSMLWCDSWAWTAIPFFRPLLLTAFFFAESYLEGSLGIPNVSLTTVFARDLVNYTSFTSEKQLFSFIRVCLSVLMGWTLLWPQVGINCSPLTHHVLHIYIDRWHSVNKKATRQLCKEILLYIRAELCYRGWYAIRQLSSSTTN